MKFFSKGLKIIFKYSRKNENKQNENIKNQTSTL